MQPNFKGKLGHSHLTNEIRKPPQVVQSIPAPETNLLLGTEVDVKSMLATQHGPGKSAHISL